MAPVVSAGAAVTSGGIAHDQLGIESGVVGYDPPMSESSNDKPETGLIPDEDLPDDLDPGENPLARDPDDEDEDSAGAAGDGSGAAAEKKIQGMPDAGDPGAAG